MQFSLKWLFVGPLCVGLLIWALLPRGHSFYWAVALRITLFLLAVPVLVMIAQGGRWARAFGLGALCPSLVGNALAASPLFHGPKGGNFQGLTILALRNLNDGSPLMDLQFRVGFLVAVGMASGLAGVGISWLANSGRSEQHFG
jgi:hypothetical protein